MRNLSLYNSLSQTKETFKPINSNGPVLMYSCGPTVYNYAHIGNFRSFIFSDLVHRTLLYCGHDVKLVMNITDVDDKTIANSQLAHMSLKFFTEKFTEIFLKDIRNLSIIQAYQYPKATEYIGAMLKMIDTLVKNGLAYEKAGSVYFKISAFKDYGKLNRIDPSSMNMEMGHRINVDEYEKENVSDFVLWKAYNEKDGDVFWESPYGIGRPGWHLECSAMSMTILGPSIDIHTGGIDLCFPHHENEIAQSEACTHKKFSNYWMHCQHLMVEGQKMSKSLGNMFTLQDIREKGYSYETIRYTLMSTHYRKSLNFIFEDLEANEKAIKRVNEFIRTIKRMTNIPKMDSTNFRNKLKVHFQKFEDSICDDLNVSAALASVFELIHKVNENIVNLSLDTIKDILNFFEDVNKIFGVFQLNEISKEIPKDIQLILQKRKVARDEKNFKLSDELRLQLEKLGYLVNDTPEGQKIEFI